LISLSKQISEVFNTAPCASPEGLNKEMLLVREMAVNVGRRDASVRALSPMLTWQRICTDQGLMKSKIVAFGCFCDCNQLNLNDMKISKLIFYKTIIY